MAHTTLILGAGLGREYGFPDGKELRELILNELQIDDKKLRDIIEWYNADTVDEIAADFPEHANQLRRIVTKILRSREDESKLKQSNSHTYGLMLKQIANAQINGDSVNILTFNYDRSLQHLLYNINKIAPKERKLPKNLVHTLYGRLAPLFHEEEVSGQRLDYHSYGYVYEPSVLQSFNYSDEDDDFYEESSIDDKRSQSLDDLCHASRIIFIGESKAYDMSASDILKRSDQIFFLGCGYHSANLKLLGFDLSQTYPDKIIAGTGLGLTDEHILNLKSQYPAIRHIERCDAFNFLRNKFDISEPLKNKQKLGVSILDVL